VAVQADTSVQEVLQLALDKSITKVPVYETNLDEILGIIHLRDLVRSMQAPEKSAKCARDLAGEVLFVPETISVNELLRELRVRRTHIAIVVDEFGGTYGLVTLEDLLEKIIGDVQGPFETTPPSIQLMPDGSALLDGMTLIEQINDFFGLKLEDPDYDTIAGYVLGKLGRIPDAGDQVEDQDNKVTLSVEKMDRLRIAQVLLSRTQ
jgi:CBS domain containing-hemolysin-like protein